MSSPLVIRPWVVVAGVLLTSGSCLKFDDPAVPANAIPFATVLPFSGERAASGANLERALQLVVSQVNDPNNPTGGGIAGRPLHLLVKDSHSDAKRGTDNARKLLNEEHAPIFIGPEEPEIATNITNDVKAEGAVHLMPGLTSPVFHDPSTNAAFFRLAPSGDYLACALAKRMLADGVVKATTVVTSDDYSGNFSTAFGTVFREKGGKLQPSLKVAAGTTSYTTLFSSLERLEVDAAVLVTTPSVAAQMIQEWSTGKHTGKWYLAPMMKDPEFLRNIPPGALDSAIGVSADIEQQTAAFAAFFQAGTGDLPLDSAAYYYDAAAMMSLTLAAAFAAENAMPTPASFKTNMMQIASAPGTVVRFDELATGLQLAASGQDIQYLGAAGSYVINKVGDSVETAAAIWTISGGEFVTVGHDTCVASEITFIQ
jgi:branched-chain amino acid transport system substrate-binding protein